MEIKLVVSDVDGTLLGDNCIPDASFFALADYIKEKKVPFTLASGRAAAQTEELAEMLHISLPRIVSNGAGIYEKDRFLFAAWIPGADVEAAVRAADEMGLAVYLSDGVQEGIYRDIPYTAGKRKKNGLPTPLIHPETKEDFAALRLQKLMVIDPEHPGRVDEILPLLNCADESFTVVRYDSRCFETMPRDCGKEMGIRRLAGLLGIRTEEVLAIGNERNDIGMLKSAGAGAAVANAAEALKEAADYVCCKETAGGVLEAVKKYFERN